MQLDKLLTYKNKIAELDKLMRNPSVKINCLEGKTKLECAIHLDRIKTISDLIIAHVKDAVTMIESPFDEAVVDNLTKSMSDIKSSCYRFINFDDDCIPFDGRDVLDPDKLNAVVEDVFRCIVAVKCHQGLSMPKAVILLDNLICDILNNACSTLSGCDTEPVEPMLDPVRVTQEPLVVFSILEKQLYFNEDELRKIEDDKRAQQEAIREAERKAKEQQEFSEAVDKLSKYTSYPRHELTANVYPDILQAARIASVITPYPFGHTPNKDGEDWPTIITLSESVRAGDLAAWANVIRYCIKLPDMRFVSMDTRSDINDRDDDTILDQGTTIEVIY